ncbi:hypothetical protein ACJJI4_16960 [Microbulbifer sp. TRSA002]|uniref:hypothetical protein n=1 Tax=Microbulbifer sp. TRSA002 TaxID=3243382 RepID=UPI00403A2B36
MSKAPSEVEKQGSWVEDWRGVLLLIAVPVILVLIVGGVYIDRFDGGFSGNNGDWGTFGDYMGGLLNPLFAYVGLIVLLSTIRLQIKELRNSTEELGHTRAELSNSAKSLKEQSESLKKQNFENTFFQLIKLHNDIVNDIDPTHQRRTLS